MSNNPFLKSKNRFSCLKDNEETQSQSSFNYSPSKNKKKQIEYEKSSNSFTQPKVRGYNRDNDIFKKKSRDLYPAKKELVPDSNNIDLFPNLIPINNIKNGGKIICSLECFNGTMNLVELLYIK